MARPNPQRQVLFNTDFEPLTPMFWCHIACIQAGGRWKKPNGEYAGMGNFYHYKEAQKLLWPEKEWHKWNDLLLKSFLDHRIIGVLGPASSGKTYEAATFALIFYYSFSDCTTVLVSSTEREMLEMRVWGEMKKAHKLATSRMHGLPGTLVESRQRLVTDDRSVDSEGRDFRNGVCFPGETLIDTPNGQCRIDEAYIGQEVINASGIGTITGIHSRLSSVLSRIKLSDGRAIDCTSEHPFFTQRGWVKAIDLETSDTVFSQNEAMQILWDPNSEQRDVLLDEMSADKEMSNLRFQNWKGIFEPEILLGQVPRQAFGETLYPVQKVLSALEPKTALDRPNHGSILQPCLRRKMDSGSSRIGSEIKQEMQALSKTNPPGASQPDILFIQVQGQSGDIALSPVRKSLCVDPAKGDCQPHSFLQLSMQNQSDWPDVPQAARLADTGGIGGLEAISSIHFKTPYSDRTCYKTQPQALVPGRYWIPTIEAGHRNRWWHSSHSGQEIEGQAKNTNPKGTRVDSVKILKWSSKSGSEWSEKGYRVYNISVSGHPSYSVNGVLVHNCGVPCKKGGQYVGLSSFIGVKNKHILLVADEGAFMPRAYVDAISNLNKNKGFKCIVLGNPKETTDALGVICEPSAELGGWDGGIDQAPMTKTWPTRFKDGICVQLVGSDCPNMDVPKDAPVPYPFLITREAIEADVAFYGMDSIQYSMMNEGRMPRGQGLRRVITRAMCLKFGAMEPPVWKSDERTRIGFLDAAYGSVGGDRCVFGELQIGKDPNDREILAVIDSMLVPVTTTSPELPEDQIALFVKTQCEQRHIKPEDVFFDSTGRGSLVGAFARLWSAHVGTVEFGGKPSERYVSDNIRVLCKDYYSKFVTELWYSVALTIQSGQFRGMTEDILLEGSMREWGFVGGNKIEIEPKDKMKLKSGRSPDLFDALACGVEGARRRGFHIAKLTNVGATADNGWRLDLAKRMERVKKRHTLNYAS